MLGANCVHLIWQAELAMIREGLDGLAARLSLAGQGDWWADWQGRFESLQRLDREQHAPKLAALVQMVHEISRNSAHRDVVQGLLQAFTEQQRVEAAALDALQLAVLGEPARVLPVDAADLSGRWPSRAVLSSLYATWRTQVLARIAMEQQLLRSADRLLAREQWSALASAFSRLTYPDERLKDESFDEQAEAVGRADAVSASASGSGGPSGGVSDAVRGPKMVRVTAGGWRGAQVGRQVETERQRPRATLLRQPETISRMTAVRTGLN